MKKFRELNNYSLFIRFISWGLVSAVIYFGSYAFLVTQFNMIPLLSSFFAFLISVATSFIFNAKFVFLNRKGSFIKFFFIALNGLALNLLIIYVFTKIFSIDELIAGIVVVVAVPVHNLVLNLILNFKKTNEV